MVVGILKGIGIFNSSEGGLTINTHISLNTKNLTDNSYHIHHARRTPRRRALKLVKSLC